MSLVQKDLTMYRDLTHNIYFQVASKCVVLKKA